MLYAGTYARAGGQGVYPLCVTAAGSWTIGEPIGDAPDASYSACSSRFGLHYLVDEANDTIGVFRVSGRWERLATLSAGGREPCFVALDPAESAIAIANYGSGTLSYYRLDPETGLPVGPPTIRQNEGRGPNGERQDGPHAHCARFSPDGRWLFQTDLGTDEILAFAHDAESGTLGEAVRAFTAPPGSGPRHLLFDATGTRAWLISELASTVTLFAVDGPRLSELQTISTLPPRYDGSSLGGHIALAAQGARLYVSNRGHDSIATFSVDDAGKLELLAHAPSGGRSPRFFLFAENRNQMLVANEEEGNIRILDRDDRGILTLDPSDLDLPGAAFLFEAPGN